MSHGEPHGYDGISLMRGIDKTKARLPRSIISVFFAVRLE